jgi:tetratricopeptide (TPR) repeat protein
LFSFDDIATFDRALYNQINNPLILRLFLEIYNGKQLPKKGVKHLHVWQDWLQTFSNEEQAFLKLLADEIWLIGKNELLIDDVLKREKLKPYFISDIISGPYNRLKNNGWISHYVKDLNGYIGFTVEGSLFYIIGIKLINQLPKVNIDFIHTILKNGTKLQKTAIESFLCEQALNGDLDLVTNLIDLGNEVIDLSITPLILFLKTFGVKATIEKVLENPTENDWNILIMLHSKLDELQLLNSKIEYSKILYNLSKEKNLILPVNILIKILPDFNYPLNEKLLSEVEDILNSGNLKNEDLILIKERFAYYCCMNGFELKGVNLFKEINETEEIENPYTLNIIGAAYNFLNNEIEAKKYYNSALTKLKKMNSVDFKILATIYFNLAAYEENELDKIKCYEKALELYTTMYGINHVDSAETISAIGRAYIELNKFDLAFKKLTEANIILNKVGSDLEDIYYNFGFYYEKLENYILAIDYYKKSLEIKILKNRVSYSLIWYFYKIGELSNIIGDFNKSIDFFTSVDILVNNISLKDTDSICFIKGQLGWLNFDEENYEAAINYFSEAIPLFIKFPSEYTKNRINTIYYLFAYSHYCLNDFEKTINILKNLIHLKPDEVNAENYIQYNELMGHCYFNLLNYIEAIDFYKKSIDFYEDVPAKLENFKLIASCYESLNKFEDAVIYYNYCLELVNEGEFEPDLSLVYFRLGVCFQNLTEYDKAISYFLIGFEIDNKDYFYIERIAKCYELADKKQMSLEYFIKVAELRKLDVKFGINDESTKDSILNAKRIAKELGIENDIPEWIKNNLNNYYEK